MWRICREVWVGLVRVLGLIGMDWAGLVRIDSAGTAGSHREGRVDVAPEISWSFRWARWEIEGIRVLRTGWQWHYRRRASYNYISNKQSVKKRETDERKEGFSWVWSFPRRVVRSHREEECLPQKVSRQGREDHEAVRLGRRWTLSLPSRRPFRHPGPTRESRVLVVKT